MGTGGGNTRAGGPGSIFLLTDKFLFVPGAYVPPTFIPPGRQGEEEEKTMEKPEFYPAGVLDYAYLGDSFPVILPISRDTRDQGVELMGKLRIKKSTAETWAQSDEEPRERIEWCLPNEIRTTDLQAIPELWMECSRRRGVLRNRAKALTPVSTVCVTPKWQHGLRRRKSAMWQSATKKFEKL